MFEGILFIAAGIFCFMGAFLNWGIFFNSGKAAFIVRIFGRKGARIFYMVLGLVIIAVGVMFLV